MKTLALFAALALTTFAADPPVTPGAAAPKDAQQLLRDGLFEEEANRDLGKAAAAYAELLAQYDLQRQLAATALFRLAEIRNKQGKKDEAVALFQRIAAEFAAFEQIAKPARERLAALGSPAPTPGADPAITNEEADELVKLREMAANSPDLLDAWKGNDTPLSRAARNGWMKAAEFLIANGAQTSFLHRGSYPLSTAAEAGHKRMIELLLDKGADMNGQDFAGVTPLMVACEKARAAVVRLMIERGANLNIASKESGRTALHSAVEGGDIGIVRLLLEKGAKPDVVWRRPQNPGQFNPEPITPLGLAAGGTKKAIAALLLEYKATADFGLADGVYQPLDAAISIRDDAFTDLILKGMGKISNPGPLNKAVENHDASTLKKLLAHHSNVDGVVGESEPCLIYAAWKAPEMVPILLDAGASPKSVNRLGDTALHHIVVAMSSAQGETNIQGNPVPVPVPARVPPPASVGTNRSAGQPGVGRRVVNPPQGQIGNRIPPPPSAGAPKSGLSLEELKQIAKGLLAKGADINARNNSEQTVLHYAAIHGGSAEVFDWLVSNGADPMAEKKGTDLPFAFLPSDRRIEFESRHLYPKLVTKESVLVVQRNVAGGLPEVVPVPRIGEFDPSPSLADALRIVFSTPPDTADGAGKPRGPTPAPGALLTHLVPNPNVPNWFTVSVYRADKEGKLVKLWEQLLAVEHSDWETSKWPEVQWGDVVACVPAGNPSGGGINPISGVAPAANLRAKIAPLCSQPRVTVDVGGRTQAVVLSKVNVSGTLWAALGASVNGTQWAPLGEVCPARNLSELVALVASGEPAIDLSAVKIVRNIEGKPREWTMDMRAEKDGEPWNPRVKRAPARLADGDRVVIPVKATAESVAERRGGIWVAAHGRVFSERLLVPERKGALPRRLSDVMWAAQLGPLVMVELDFSKITIHRLKGDSGEEEHIAADLATPLAAWKKERADVARKADIELQWGDVVEFGAIPGVKPAELRSIGGGEEKGEFLRDMLTRTVKVGLGKGPMREKVLHAPIIPTRGVTERSGIFEWFTKEPEEAFLAVPVVKNMADSIGPETDYRKLVRVRITSGGEQRVLGREELEASKEWLRDGDELVIETL